MLISLNSSYLFIFLIEFYWAPKTNEVCFISPTVKITFQLGCERPKIIHKIHLQDMTIILRKSFCAVCSVRIMELMDSNFKSVIPKIKHWYISIGIYLLLDYVSILPGLILPNSLEKTSGKPVALPLLGTWQYLFTNLLVGQG